MPPPLDIAQYDRKPLRVDAVQITEGNIHQAAKWCGGYVDSGTRGNETNAKFVKVHVLRPGNVRQTQAFVGDWLLRTTETAGKNSIKTYKVFTTNAFEASFNPAPTPPPQAVDA